MDTNNYAADNVSYVVESGIGAKKGEIGGGFGVWGVDAGVV